MRERRRVHRRHVDDGRAVDLDRAPDDVDGPHRVDDHRGRSVDVDDELGAPVDPADQEIIDAYVAYWDARFAANSGVPNPQDPALARYATGAQLEAVIAETQKNLDAGEAFQPAPEPVNFRRVTVVSVDGDRAEVQECFVDDGQVIERDTGVVLDDGVSTQSVIGNLRFVDGQWRVSGSKLVQQWEGVAGCALAS